MIMGERVAYHQSPKLSGTQTTKVSEDFVSFPAENPNPGIMSMCDWLAVSTHLKNISQIGSHLPQIGMKIFKKYFETTIQVMCFG